MFWVATYTAVWDVCTSGNLRTYLLCVCHLECRFSSSRLKRTKFRFGGKVRMKSSVIWPCSERTVAEAEIAVFGAFVH